MVARCAVVTTVANKQGHCMSEGKGTRREADGFKMELARIGEWSVVLACKPLPMAPPPDTDVQL